MGNCFDKLFFESEENKNLSKVEETRVENLRLLRIRQTQDNQQRLKQEQLESRNLILKAEETTERTRLFEIEKSKNLRKVEETRSEKLLRLLRIRQTQVNQQRLKQEQLILKAEKTKRRRLEHIETERIRIQQVEEAKEEIKELLCIQIDYFIRTRRKFDSRDPLACTINLKSIVQDLNIQSIFGQLKVLNVNSITILDFISGHFTTYANGQVGVKNLTPFQGTKTHCVYGYFKCGNCQRTWESAASWKNKWQKCKGCESKCYPYQQDYLLHR